MTKKKTLAIFSAFYPPHIGGVERYAKHLAESLAGIGHKVYIITSNTHLQDSIEEKNGVTIYRLPVREFINGRYPVIKNNSGAKRLIKEIDALDIDIYIMNMRFYPISIYGAKLARKKNKKAILIEHATGHFTVNNKLYDSLGHFYEHRVTKYINKKIDDYYGVSKACTGWLEHFGISAKGIIYNGVENKKANTGTNFIKNLELSGNDLVFTFAGRLIEEKGVNLLCDVFSGLKAKYPNAVLLIAGEGKLQDKLVRKYEGNPNIRILGYVSHDKLMALLNRSDGLLFPSMYPEGLPTILLEAGLHKCAVATTPMGGSSEIIDSGEYGITIEPGNKKELLAGIEKLINDTDYRKTVSENLHKKVIENFTWDRIALKFSNELEKGFSGK